MVNIAKRCGWRSYGATKFHMLNYGFLWAQQRLHWRDEAYYAGVMDWIDSVGIDRNSTTDRITAMAQAPLAVIKRYRELSMRPSKSN